MTPPIRLRTDTSNESGGTVMPIVPATAMAGDAITLPPSQFADYAYRIATLTAGLALLATFI
jgi:hypothetical protein